MEQQQQQQQQYHREKKDDSEEEEFSPDAQQQPQFLLGKQRTHRQLHKIDERQSGWPRRNYRKSRKMRF